VRHFQLLDVSFYDWGIYFGWSLFCRGFHKTEKSIPLSSFIAIWLHVNLIPFRGKGKAF
jgi:hypothetical protein